MASSVEEILSGEGDGNSTFASSTRSKLMEKKVTKLGQHSLTLYCMNPSVLHVHVYIVTHVHVYTVVPLYCGHYIGIG